MHPPELRHRVAGLLDEGLRDAEVVRVVGLPRSTVRSMRIAAARPLCLRCWRPTRPVRCLAEDYAELLGLYLGDGCIASAGRTQRLRISLDARYPAVVARTEHLLRRCLPANRVGAVRADGGATTVVSVYSSHLSCLFPQHGAGRKHERPIVLEPWQEDAIREAPGAFLRGCVHSDGCRFVNRTGRYSYVAYGFANVSPEIVRIFCWACELLGVQPPLTGSRVRINRRRDVALLDRYVGSKA